MHMFPYSLVKSNFKLKITLSDKKNHRETVITKMPLAESNVCKKTVVEPLILVTFTKTLKVTIFVTSERLN